MTQPTPHNKKKLKQINLYISPCPNDTFAFFALIKGIVTCENITIQHHFRDIEQLNNVALNNHDPNSVCKISCATIPHITQNYTLLKTGAAMGFGNAPLLVAKENILPLNARIALPGKYTTAAALLKKFFPKLTNTSTHTFNEIIPLIENNNVDAGVIIHEGRFVYKEHNLNLIADLGELWEQNHPNTPIPLGCIVANNQLGEDTIKELENAIAQSVKYALNNPTEPMEFVREHAQELDPNVLQKHISYFVNKLTIDMGDIGRAAITILNN